MERGTLFVISGPSGVGKGTVISRLLDADPTIWKSVSATTRKPREGEREGEDYFFLDKDEFLKKASDGGFLEWAEYSGNMYGTPAASVEDHLAAGEDVVLEIDVQGALQVRDNVPDAVLVFIEPPSREELERRLRKRGTEDEETIQRRLKAADMELSRKMEYDECFVNDTIDGTVLELARFMRECSSNGQRM